MGGRLVGAAPAEGWVGLAVKTVVAITWHETVFPEEVQEAMASAARDARRLLGAHLDDFAGDSYATKQSDPHLVEQAMRLAGRALS